MFPNERYQSLPAHEQHPTAPFTAHVFAKKFDFFRLVFWQGDKVPTSLLCLPEPTLRRKCKT